MLDAAHNPHGAEATAAALEDSFTLDPLIGVIGVMADKDAEGLLAAFEPHLAHVVCTQNSTERAMPADELAEVAIEVFGEDRVTVEPRLADAIDQAAALAEEGRQLVDRLRRGAGHRLGRHRRRGADDAAGGGRREHARAGAVAAPRDVRRGAVSLEAITLGLTTPVLITVADVDVAGRPRRRARARRALPADRRAAAARVGLRARAG